MTSKIIDGKAHAAAIRKEVKDIITSHGGAAPHLAVVLVGENPASLVYIKHKQGACEEIGINFSLHSLPETATQQEVLNTIDALNNNPDVHGILVQQPLPPKLNTHEVVLRVDPKKDVDCLHPHNLGLVAMGQAQMLPCTPSGVVNLLKRENIDISGKHAVIVGRSNIVGKPLAFMLLEENATITICHSRTKNLPQVCQTADILVAAIGDANYITADYVKEGAVVIDVGINRQGKKLCGDVDYKNVLAKASYITPVPGGVGPMTVAILMENCVRAYRLQR